ncbi:hypothetical protein CDL15_Pgr012293 [Punica granatum]|uniref:Uncharacterized protein n=1 Tax=Punica granatum TaxID=22663 RepID=A0A218WRR7_PUNGR|nr:hypothetical protein CDL15_Pgr012293 [Punica granatum]
MASGGSAYVVDSANKKAAGGSGTAVRAGGGDRGSLIGWTVGAYAIAEKDASSTSETKAGGTTGLGSTIGLGSGGGIKLDEA